MDLEGRMCGEGGPLSLSTVRVLCKCTYLLDFDDCYLSLMLTFEQRPGKEKRHRIDWLTIKPRFTHPHRTEMFLTLVVLHPETTIEVRASPHASRSIEQR